MTYIIIILITVLSYLVGGFSTARILVKSVRSLNIYKIGTGLADTENIYQNVSKPMGFLVGLIDASKSYLYLMLVSFVLQFLDRASLGGTDLGPVHQGGIMMLYAAALLIGHCLPLTNKLRGGRGIFTYLGIMAYFAFLPALLTAMLAWLLVWIWKQIRFAQYTIVILPMILTVVFSSYFPRFQSTLGAHLVPQMIGLILLMGILNFIVSKKLGEF